MRFVEICRAAAAVGAVLLVAGPAASRQGGDIPLLGRLEGGLWELRARADDRRIGSVCLGDKSLLVQPQHGGATCSHMLIGSDLRSVTVHYTCPAAGFGRTTLRVETPRLVQIESQGIHRNAPFGLRAEARRIGPCR